MKNRSPDHKPPTKCKTSLYTGRWDQDRKRGLIGGQMIKKNVLMSLTKMTLQKLKDRQRRCKELEDRYVLNEFTRLLVLLFLLLFKLFSEIALPVAIQLRLVTVFAKYARNIFLVDLVICNGSPLTKSRQDGRNKPYVNYKGTHQIGRKDSNFQDPIHLELDIPGHHFKTVFRFYTLIYS